MLVFAFTACQSLNYIKEKNETIQLVVKGNDNNIYMLGNNYDYQFSGKDADRLLRLSNFPKELNFSREQLKNALKENGASQSTIDDVKKDNNYMFLITCINWDNSTARKVAIGKLVKTINY